MVKRPNRVKQAAARLRGKTALLQMRTDDRTDLYGRNYHRTGFERLASSALDYLRSRSSDHWLMFVVGLAIGLFLG